MKSTRTFYPKLAFYTLLTFSFIACEGWQHPRERTLKRVVLPANETHEGWYFAAGDQVVIQGTVNGDAYVAGGVVEVDGTINGDLLVAGGMVTVGGTVSDDIRAAGGTIHFNGKVGKNIAAAGGSIIVSKSASVNGNLLVACGTLEVTGTVDKEAKVVAGEAGFGGAIKGNVDFTGDYISVPAGAMVGGNLKARIRDKEHVDIAAGTVRGKVDVSLAGEAGEMAHVLGYRPWRFWFKVLWAAGLLVVGLALVFFFPRKLQEIRVTLTGRTAESFLIGILGLIIIPVLSLMFFVTVIGIPLGLFLVTVFLWMVYCSQLGLAILLADRILPFEGKTGWSLFVPLAVGIVAVQVLTFIPYVRFLVNVVSVIFGVGAILIVARKEFSPEGAP